MKKGNLIKVDLRGLRERDYSNLEKLQCKREEGSKEKRKKKKVSDRMERKLKVIKVIEQWERR